MNIYEFYKQYSYSIITVQLCSAVQYNTRQHRTYELSVNLSIFKDLELLISHWSVL